MPEFVIHSIPGSPYGRAPLVLLEEKGAAYRFAPVKPGTTKIAPHILRHPFGRIPVLEHGDFTLFETQAILRYIDRVLPEPALTPADPRAAGLMDQALNVNDWYLFQGVGNIIGFQRVVAPRVLGLSGDDAAVEAAMPRAQEVFTQLSRLLGDQTWFAGATFSLADILLGAHLDLLSSAAEWSALTEGRDNLRDWLVRLNGRPSFAATTWEKVADMAAGA